MQDTPPQHVIGHGESIGEGRLLVGDAEQILVGDDEQRIDEFLQLLDADLGRPHAPHPFELEGLGDDATVKMPSSREARAMTGAAPVPVRRPCRR